MIARRDVVFISSIEWDELWQSNQEIAARLAAAGSRVLYIENIGVRAPAWRDRTRVAARLAAWWRALRGGGVRKVADRLWVVAPLLMPPFGSRAARELNRRLLVPLIVRKARKLGLLDPVVWTYLPTDTALELIARLRSPASPIVYSCLSDFSERVADASRLTRAERELVRGCDVTFALPDLVGRLQAYGGRVVAYEPGVDTELFDPAAERSVPDRLRRLSGPVIGYVGGLQRNVDLALLEELARARPDWSWVYVGPAYVSVDGLARHPNVSLLGPLAHDQLPDVVASFDVCLSPLQHTGYTASMVPTKIGEYLAMGKPVVSTAIPHALRLERAAKGVMVTAEPRPREFLAAIERALLLAADEGTAARCQAVAAAFAWPRRLEEMSAALAAAPRWQRRAHQPGQPPRVVQSGHQRQPAEAEEA